jgi:hypothetical protein
LVFNLWEKENLLFLYFVVSGTFWISESSGIFARNYLSQDASGEVEVHERSHEAQMGMGGETTG